jgi:hypothetical protein
VSIASSNGYGDTERPVASALLSSSPPQMNEFTNVIAETLDEGDEAQQNEPRKDGKGVVNGSWSTHLLPSPALDERQPLLRGAPKAPVAASKSKR